MLTITLFLFLCFAVCLLMNAIGKLPEWPSILFLGLIVALHVLPLK